MSKRNALIEATKALLAERGYESMSPTAILERSGAGQGSLYHHFRGKADIASTALRDIAGEVLELNAQTLNDSDRSSFENVIANVTAQRPAIRGCQIGRYANENDVVETPELREPIREYFKDQIAAIRDVLRQAKAEGDLDTEVDVDELATTLTAVIQGGYALARIFQEPLYMERATRGIANLLERSRQRLNRA